MEFPAPLQFIKDNWVKMALTWNDSNNNLPGTIHSDILSYLERGVIPKGIWWSCFDCTGLILDIYGVYSRETSDVRTIVNDINTFEEEFIPGHIYQFGIMNHEFIVIYDLTGIIYYIDYYMETGRGCRQLNPKQLLPSAFRLDAMCKEDIFKYIESYLRENFTHHTLFHKGDSSYYEEYVNDYKYAKNLDHSICNFSKLDFAKYKILGHPTIPSILDTINKSVTDHDILYGNFNTPEEKETWLKIRKFLLNSLEQ